MIIRQTFTQLVSIITKKIPISNDENLTKKLLLKLVESIHYYYLPKKLIIETAWIIWIIIAEIKGFTKGSTSYIIFVNLKKEEEKNQVLTSIFESFIWKLSKDKGYQPVKDLT